MNSNIRPTIECIEKRGLVVTSWKPGNRRIFKVLDAGGNEISCGMYSNELGAWFQGYIEGESRNEQ